MNSIVVCIAGLNLHVQAGQHVALVGPSGSGKSTLVAMLMRFYDPLQGSILIDGVDLRELDPQWLRQQVGMVMQEPVLFSGTVTDNIVFDQGPVPHERVVEAAKLANAHDFIMAKPEGYDSLLGEKGISLSGGEKQRVAIARAILRRPKILLLDEATSALDNESEGLVQQALYRLTEGKTMLVIAHRLSTITGCDGVAIFEPAVQTKPGSGKCEMRVGREAVLEYIASHAAEEAGVLPPSWDDPLLPALEALSDQLNGLRLAPEQIEAAAKQITQRLHAKALGDCRGGGDGQGGETDGGDGSGTGGSSGSRSGGSGSSSGSDSD